jgi:hypothetical protein
MSPSQKKQRPKSSSQLVSHKKYTSVDELFGKILGIERLLLCDRSDTLLEAIEKINLIPEHKLLIVEPIIVEIKGRNVIKPQVKNLITLSDICSVFQ